MTITNPTYYKNLKGEDLITYFANNFTHEQFVGFMVGNIIKYVTRFEGKNGLEDIRKANEYIVRLHDELQRLGTEVSFDFDDSWSKEMSRDDLKKAVEQVNAYGNETNTRPKENRESLEKFVDSINEVNDKANEKIEQDKLIDFYNEESKKHELRDWLHNLNQSVRASSNDDLLLSMFKTIRKGKH